MPRNGKGRPAPARTVKNYTTKLDPAFQLRVERAMMVRGVGVFNEFSRLALMELCRRTEAELLRDNPAEYARIYQEPRP